MIKKKLRKFVTMKQHMSGLENFNNMFQEKKDIKRDV